MNYKNINGNPGFITDIHRVSSLIDEHFNDDTIKLEYWGWPDGSGSYSVELYVLLVNNINEPLISKITTELSTIRLPVDEYGKFFDKHQEAIVIIINEAKLELLK